MDDKFYLMALEEGIKTRHEFKSAITISMYDDSPEVQLVCGVVCGFFNISMDRIKNGGRKRPIVTYRQILCYFISIYTGLPPRRIAEMIGGQDRTTVIHSVSAVKILMETDEKVNQQIEALDEAVNKVVKKYQNLNGNSLQNQTE